MFDKAEADGPHACKNPLYCVVPGHDGHVVCLQGKMANSPSAMLPTDVAVAG